jgi:hypothetical protein
VRTTPRRLREPLAAAGLARAAAPAAGKEWETVWATRGDEPDKQRKRARPAPGHARRLPDFSACGNAPTAKSLGAASQLGSPANKMKRRCQLIWLPQACWPPTCMGAMQIRRLPQPCDAHCPPVR